MNATCVPVRRAPRSGIAVLWALVVLSVLGVTSATAAWHFVAARRVLDGRLNKVQALWLARSGAELAAARLLAHPDDYTGEVVEPIPESHVRIAVEKAPGRPDAYVIRCEARYPTTGPTSVGLALAWTATRRSDPAAVRLELLDPDGRDVRDGDKGP
jgi:hypothetical protein